MIPSYLQLPTNRILNIADGRCGHLEELFDWVSVSTQQIRRTIRNVRIPCRYLNVTDPLSVLDMIVSGMYGFEDKGVRTYSWDPITQMMNNGST